MPERLERSEGPVINALLTFVERHGCMAPGSSPGWSPFFAPQAALFAVSH